MIQPVEIQKGLLREQMLERNNPRMKRRVKFLTQESNMHKIKDESGMPLGNKRMRAGSERGTCGHEGN